VFRISGFGFPSDLGFRISDFIKVHASAAASTSARFRRPRSPRPLAAGVFAFSAVLQPLLTTRVSPPTCRPHCLLVITGPPFSKERDSELAERVPFNARKAIGGDTTATIAARLLKREVTMLLNRFDLEVSPTSEMAGVGIVTAGTITAAVLTLAGSADNSVRLLGVPDCPVLPHP
jgi:hypothetical protein